MGKKLGPIFHLQVCEISTLVISSKELAEEALKIHDLEFAQRPKSLIVKIVNYNGSGLIFSPHGGKWREMRKICVLEFLSAIRVESFKLIREGDAWGLIQSISNSLSHGDVPINLSKMIFGWVSSMVSKAVFGKKYKEVDEFKMEKRQRRIDEIIEHIISEHKAKRESFEEDESMVEDLVYVLLRLKASGELKYPLTTNNVKGLIVDIMAAGSVNPPIVIEWAMAELLKNPRVMEKAQAEVRQVLKKNTKIKEKYTQELIYLKAVVKETLPLHPPIPLIQRECSKICEINGYQIPMNTKILINAWAIGRDPKEWTDPNSFKPERFLDSSINFVGSNYEYIPFGAGRRMCPGGSFGLSIATLLLAHFLFHFDWKLPYGIKYEELDMSEVSGPSNKKLNDLFVIPVVYVP
ncbi:hypothetical protein LguiB_032799 [Lonicera macranthoides]